MNKFIGTGNLCKENELRYTTSNIAVLSNSIGIRNDFKNAKGEYETTFINFVAYRNNAEFLNKYANKGDKILIEGRINNRNYDKQDGTKAYITEVIVEKVELLGKKQENTQSEGKQCGNPYQNAQNNQNIVEKSDVFAEFANEIEYDDPTLELPF